MENICRLTFRTTETAIKLHNPSNVGEVAPGNWGPAVTAGLITCPLASFISRLTRSVVGMNRVTSPMTCRICGLASIVADVDSLLSSLGAGAALCGGFMMLGGALSTPGLAPAAAGGICNVGGGTFSGKPGGRTSRGGGTPVTHSETTTKLHRMHHTEMSQFGWNDPGSADVPSQSAIQISGAVCLLRVWQAGVLRCGSCHLECSDHIHSVADPVKFRKLLKSQYFSQVFNICWLLHFSIQLTFVMNLRPFVRNYSGELVPKN